MPTIAFDIEVAGFPWTEVDEITRGYLLARARTPEERDAVSERTALYPGLGKVIAIGMWLVPEDKAEERGMILLEGRAEEVRDWATRTPHGYLHQRLELESMREDERGRHVVAFARREWSWKDRENVEEREDLAIVATINDGLIARWQPFEDPDEALRAAGIAE